MSKKSATDTIKQLNPKNISGAIPQALDLIQNLKKVKPTDNPKMPDAVGPQQLVQMLQFIAQLFGQNKQKDKAGNPDCQIYLDKYNQTGNTAFLDEYTLCIATNGAANTIINPSSNIPGSEILTALASQPTGGGSGEPPPSGEADVTPPTVPLNVRAVAVGPDEIDLSWTESTDE